MTDDVNTPERSRADELSDLLDQDIPGWRPTVGEKLIGRVLAIETAGQGSAFGTYSLLTVRREDGTLVGVHAFHTVLRNGIERADPKVGDMIGIKYVGREIEGGEVGTGYEDYRVRVQHA